MTENIAILFTHGSAPYEAGDIAGFPAKRAQQFVDAGRAVFYRPITKADPFARLTRAELVLYARDRLGLVDEPPAEVSDDDLRDALRASADEPTPPKVTKGGK